MMLLFWLVLFIIAFILACIGVGIWMRKSNAREVKKEIIEKADKDDVVAKKKLQELFRVGMTGEEYQSLRLEIYKTKAEKGDAFAEYFMGLLASKDTDSEYWWTRAAEHGNIDAMNALAMGYSKQINEDADVTDRWVFGYNPEKEKHWRMCAARTGDANAQLNMGNYFRWNTTDVPSAIFWYEKAMFNSAKNCNWKVLFEVYRGLADVYDALDVRYGNVDKEKEMLLRILTFVQEHKDVYIEDFDEEYSRAALRLGQIMEFNCNDKRKAAYCYLISAKTGTALAEQRLSQLSYPISEHEYSDWSNDARNLRFCMNV